MGKFYESAVEELSLHVKQLAWLHAAPAADKGNRKTTTHPPSRMQQMTSQGITPQLPDPGPAGHLVGYLFDAGPISAAGMGAVAISHGELAAWQANTGIELAAWECGVLRRLSADYLTASRAAAAADCPPFYVDPATTNRDAVAHKVSAIFGGMAKTRKAH